MGLPGRGPVWVRRGSQRYTSSPGKPRRERQPRCQTSPGAERDDVTGGKAHPDHDSGLHGAHRVRQPSPLRISPASPLAHSV